VMNEYLNTINLANMKDNSYYDSVNRELDLANSKYSATEKEKQKMLDTIGQYSSDYQAKINEFTNDKDTSNDWMIPYLQTARQDKISGQNSANATGQQKAYESAFDMFKELGYATPEIASILGIPQGTKSESYTNMMSDNSRTSSKAKAETSKELTLSQKQALGDDARALLKMWYPDKTTFTESEFEDAYSYLYKMYTSDPSELQLDKDLEEEMQNRAITSDVKTGNLPGLNIRNGSSIYDLVK